MAVIDVGLRTFWLSSINLKVVADHILVPASARAFLPMFLHVWVRSRSGSGTPALINIGTNGTNYDNVTASISVGDIFDSVKSLALTPAESKLRVDLNNNLILQVDTASTYTTNVADFWITGIMMQ